MSSINFGCVILAAGQGKRFGSRKQTSSFEGKELWKHTYESCKKVTNEVVVVGIDIPGGRTRQESVFEGLKNIKSKRVVIVESARPLVTPKQIKEIGEDIHNSCSYAMKSVDTIYYKNKHLQRDYCYRLQVPQSFNTKLLYEAHCCTKERDLTDDTILMKYQYGIEPKLFSGGKNLFKVTFPEDLKYLEVLKCML